jgi:hypothetical protein
MLPGRCMTCGASVSWYARAWREPRRPLNGKPAHRHVCAEDRAVCGAFMPQVRERCARRPGHAWEHRSSYALENARRKGLVA